MLFRINFGIHHFALHGQYLEVKMRFVSKTKKFSKKNQKFKKTLLFGNFSEIFLTREYTSCRKKNILWLDYAKLYPKLRKTQEVN